MMIILNAIWLMLPAYITNLSAGFFKGKTPIDLGIHLGKDRLLGDGKTYGGFLKGTLCGVLCAIIQNPFFTTFGPFPLCSVTIFCLTAGAMLGDLLGSFIKRRLGLKRGAPLPIVDQLNFVVGAWLLLLLFARNWFIASFTSEIIVIVIVITPLMHLLTNYIGFKLGRKDVPW